MAGPDSTATRVLAAVAALGLSAGLAGAAGIHLPGTQPADGSGDPAYPVFLNEANPGRFDAPGICDNCHAGYRAAGQDIHEPFDSWAGSLMANAARDPLFWAAVDVANQDDALLGDAGVGDFCIRCHVPVAWYEGRSDCATAWGEDFDGSCFEGPMSTPDTDFEGLTCHFCHRMYDAGLPPAGQFQDPAAPHGENGQVYLTSESNTMLGPYADADPRRHQFRASEFMRSSAFCGQCHDVTNPALNRRDPVSGADLGMRMPVERTWSEYRQSAYADESDPAAATCQDCHMTPPDFDDDGEPDPAYAAQQEPFLRGDDPAEGDFHVHWFAGGGSWMIEVLQAEHGAALERDEEYAAARAQSLDLLQRRTVELSLDAPAAAVAGGSLDLSATVTNRGGHKFPTGYPEGRRAWLRLRAGQDLDGDGALQDGELLFSSGSWDPATGVLAEDPQLVVYELKVGVWDWNGTGACDTTDGAGRKLFHFVLNDCIAKDNRIPPLGFVPNADTAPVGHAYPENPARPGTLANSDESGYSVPLPPGISGELLVEAAVLYQTTSKEYVEFLRDENLSTCDPFDPGCDPTVPDARPNRGEKMFALWEAHGRSAPVELALATATVPLDPAPPVAACCVGDDCFALSEADCLDAAGTWQGEGSDCASVDCTGPAAVPGEARDLRVSREAGGDLRLSWTPACDATDHALLFTELGAAAAGWSAATCGHGVSGAATVPEPAGSVAFVVIGQTSGFEGSLGRDSFGLERPELDTGAACDRPQDLSPACE